MGTQCTQLEEGIVGSRSAGLPLNIVISGKLRTSELKDAVFWEYSVYPDKNLWSLRIVIESLWNRKIQFTEQCRISGSFKGVEVLLQDLEKYVRLCYICVTTENIRMNSTPPPNLFGVCLFVADWFRQICTNNYNLTFVKLSFWYFSNKMWEFFFPETITFSP